MRFSKQDVFPMDNSPGFLLNRTAQEISAHLLRSFKSNGCDVTPQQWGLLSRLWEQEGLTQNELAEKTLKDRHNVARMLALMEANGLIERLADTHDHRIQRVYLTESGKSLQPKLTGIVLEVLDQAFYGMKAGEVERLREICGKLLDNLTSLNLPPKGADPNEPV